jgi:hypothetical protein
VGEKLDKLIEGLELLPNRPLMCDLELIAKWVDQNGAKELVGFPAERERLINAVCKAFQLTRPQLEAELERGHAQKVLDYTDDFMDLVPPKGLLRDYVIYTLGSESPTAFHAFSFLTVLGATLGRQICVDQQIFQIWPNMCTILVGPSGQVSKTTAANFAVQLAYKAEGALACDEALQFGDGRFELIAEKATSEAIHTRLAGKDPATGLLYAGELSTFLNKKEYNKSLIQDLTRLWDCPDILPVRTQSRDHEILRNVAVSFLGCSNEAWLVDSLPEDAFKGGFMARVLQIYQPDTDRVFPEPKRLDKDLAEKLTYGVVESAICKGEVVKTRAASKYYNKRYHEIKKNFPDDERMKPFFARLPDHMLRLAMLLSVCESRVENVFITDEHLFQADQIMNWILKWLPKVYSFMGVTNVGADARRILFALVKNGGRMARHELITKMVGRLTVRQLDERLHTLRQARIIGEVSGGLFEKTRQCIYYKLLKRPEDLT